ASSSTPTSSRTAVRIAGIPDASALAERWAELGAALRTSGKGMAATALEHASPVTVTASGDVTIALDEANAIYERALESVRGELLVHLRGWYDGITRVIINAATEQGMPPERLTDEMVRSERLAAMRQRDPVLDRAVDALDLDLAD
nr:hypothetical protein [Gemmatimonadaceae bacterium]